MRGSISTCAVTGAVWADLGRRVCYWGETQLLVMAQTCYQKKNHQLLLKMVQTKSYASYPEVYPGRRIFFASKIILAIILTLETKTI